MFKKYRVLVSDKNQLMPNPTDQRPPSNIGTTQCNLLYGISLKMYLYCCCIVVIFYDFLLIL